MYFLHGFREGWTSTIVLVLLSTSVVLLAIGAIGVYVGKIFEQVKQRPLYLTRDSVNLPDSPGSLPPRAE
jgi:dolichol-phosphate mannosyltransferase